MTRQLSAIPAAVVLFLVSVPLVAEGDTAKIEALERKIDALQARIVALEARETFTSFMPDFAERFHVMHRAGDSGDWAVASHELQELKRLTRLSISIDAEKGRIMGEMMNPSFEALENAIGHGNHKKFQTALVEATNTCNACHVATGSGFVQVSLEPAESLTIRHPHKFSEQAVPGGHSH